ncbi:MAG: tRNA glutamyl-Q(34) synthetase GluQRS [Granulosicoccus sp.]
MSDYTGRFAPTPSGPLHVGSLVAALASRADALAHQGRWYCRIDNIDPPREVSGSAQGLLNTLSEYSLDWHDDVIWQSDQLDKYSNALKTLQAQGTLFRCYCSRKFLTGRPCCASNCRQFSVRADDCELHDKPDISGDYSIRLALTGELTVRDRIQPPLVLNFDKDLQDVVLRRRDCLASYALACAVDDATVITHVVRGADLFPGSAIQIAIMQQLDLLPPVYAHTPVIVDLNGRKLGKQTGAEAIDKLPRVDTLLYAWQLLGQSFEPAQRTKNIEEFWHLVPSAWSIDKVPRRVELPA